MSLNNLAKGTSIDQRHDILKEYYEKNHLVYSNSQLENYKKWRERPTTVTDERFQEILDSKNLTKEKFDFAIKELSKAEKEYIFETISDDLWVKITQEIFAYPDMFKEDIFNKNQANFTYAIRMHIGYFEKKLKKILTNYPTISVQSSGIIDYVDEVMNRMLDIGMRTFVYDLHAEKEKMNLGTSADEKADFQQYLLNRFGSTEKLIEFFCQYPVLTRLYAELIHFQIKNFTDLVQALFETEPELHQVFGIEKPICLTGLKMGAGDSHDRGKSVLILTFNEEKEVVFKPKNLKIGNRFDLFVREINKMDQTFDFYLTKKIVKSTYTFEERLVYLECQSEEEVRHYYRQFGQTIALVYLLNGNDFHLENVLACGKYPVLIDLETIIQNHFPMPDSDNALMKVIQDNAQSVVASGLVPIYLFEERAEADVQGASKGIQISALSGGEQKLPYKILKLVNFDSVNMQFNYQEHITEASENIPLFQGEKVDFVPFIDTIIAGFKEFSAFALKNREALAQLAEEMFSDCLVRNVIKETQSYADLLDYSTHPSCMVDYIEREKLFENLWMHNYSSSKPVIYEVRDMLQHDVPIFFNPTSGYDLVASQNELIKDMYQEKAIDLERV